MLDFLHASCLAGNAKYKPFISHAEAICNMYIGIGMCTIQAAAGKEKFIIRCGCPIGLVVGFVDGVRVSCDTGPTVAPPFPFWHSGEQQCLLLTLPDLLTTTTNNQLNLIGSYATIQTMELC
jgi:hypothetical protein